MCLKNNDKECQLLTDYLTNIGNRYHIFGILIENSTVV